MKHLALITLALFLAACTRATAARAPLIPQTPTLTNPLPSKALTLSETPAATITPTEVMCAFVEGRQTLADISAQLLAGLKDTGLPVETARAEAYGENCVAADGNVVRFAARETDFYITLNVPDLTDEKSLGRLLEQTLAVIDKFTVDQTPGPNSGYIGITFKAGDQVQNLWFMRTQANDFRAQGLKSADLYRALKGAP
jgi:hypothetical protein